MSEQSSSEATSVEVASKSDLGGALLLDRLLTIAEATREFVATTSYYRQRVVSRPAFERMAVALLDLSVTSNAAQGVAPKDLPSGGSDGTGKEPA